MYLSLFHSATTEQVAYIVFDPPAETFAAADTNQDGHVTPLDALLVINWLNASGSGQNNAASQRLDVNRDGSLTPADALWVINDLNQIASLGGEGEGEPMPGGSALAPHGSNRDVLAVQQSVARVRALDRIFGDLDDNDAWSLSDELLDELV